MDLNNLSNNTILELREFGKEIGVKSVTRYKKAELVELIQARLTELSKSQMIPPEKKETEAEKDEKQAAPVRRRGRPRKTPVIDAEKQKAEETAEKQPKKADAQADEARAETVQADTVEETPEDRTEAADGSEQEELNQEEYEKGSLRQEVLQHFQPSHTRAAEQQRCRRCLRHTGNSPRWVWISSFRKLYARKQGCLYITISDQALQPQDRGSGNR